MCNNTYSDNLNNIIPSSETQTAALQQQTLNGFMHYNLNYSFNHLTIRLLGFLVPKFTRDCTQPFETLSIPAH